jgi:hypothetical protein
MFFILWIQQFQIANFALNSDIDSTRGSSFIFEPLNLQSFDQLEQARLTNPLCTSIR